MVFIAFLNAIGVTQHISKNTVYPVGSSFGFDAFRKKKAFFSNPIQRKWIHFCLTRKFCDDLLMLNEKQLVEQCIANSPGALDELYKRYAPLLFGICLRYTKNQQEAEDLLHDGFIRILDSLKQFRHDGSFEGWLRRIMVTSAINHFRKNKHRLAEQELTDYRLNSWSSDLVMANISAQEILGLIQDLPDGYQMVFNLHVIEGYKHREIAEMLNISESTSKSQYMKARKALQQSITDMNREAKKTIVEKV